MVWFETFMLEDYAQLSQPQTKSPPISHHQWSSAGVPSSGEYTNIRTLEIQALETKYLNIDELLSLDIITIIS